MGKERADVGTRSREALLERITPAVPTRGPPRCAPGDRISVVSKTVPNSLDVLGHLLPKFDAGACAAATAVAIAAARAAGPAAGA